MRAPTSKLLTTTTTVVLATFVVALARCDQSDCVMTQRIDCEQTVHLTVMDADVDGYCVGLPPGFTPDDAYPDPSHWAFQTCYAERYLGQPNTDAMVTCGDEGGVTYICGGGQWAQQL